MHKVTHVNCMLAYCFISLQHEHATPNKSKGVLITVNLHKENIHIYSFIAHNSKLKNYGYERHDDVFLMYNNC